MKRTIIALSTLLAVAATNAQAATCADRDHVVNQLETRFGETIIANAISPSNRVLEIFASPDKSTWSVTVFLPERGLSCLAATGRGEEALKTALSQY